MICSWNLGLQGGDTVILDTHTDTIVDDALHHLLPWDIELIIDEPVDEDEEEPEVTSLSVHYFYHTYFVY